MKELLLQSSTLYSALWVLFRIRHRQIAIRSQDWWKRTRGIHSGQRGFVIGNGPSLRMSDLDRLKSEVCIASNKIYLAFEETQWRPQYLTCVDKLVWQKIQQDLLGRFKEIIVISTIDVRNPPIPVIVARHLGGHESVAGGFSLNGATGMFGGRTVTYFNLQLAAHLGLNPIYLIGCDHYYSGESKAKDEGSIITHSAATNHFSPKYRSTGERVNSAPIGEMNAAFGVGRRVADYNGIQIVNATRGGHLESFERASFDELF
jgi:hypothetical protein